MAASCAEYKSFFLQNFKGYEVLALTAPGNFTVWTERSKEWNIVYYIYLAISAALFILLGATTTLLLFKKDAVRLQSKLFVTIYVCISIMGFSRGLWLALDPYGLVGFIGGLFPQWFIISRILEAIGFPCLDLCYTLMIVALLKISNKPRQQWHHGWAVILPTAIVIFSTVIIAEAIALAVPYPGVISVIICELLFVIAGETLCVLYLIAGNRLLRQLKRSERRSTRLSSDTGNAEIETSAEFAHRELRRHRTKTRRTKRKITLITYATVVTTIIYSFVIFGRTVLTCYLLYGSCLGFMDQRAPSEAWLLLEISQRVCEMVLALFLLYSITDLQIIRKFLCANCSIEEN